LIPSLNLSDRLAIPSLNHSSALKECDTHAINSERAKRKRKYHRLRTKKPALRKRKHRKLLTKIRRSGVTIFTSLACQRGTSVLPDGPSTKRKEKTQTREA
jgi:hypothetical protein